MLGQEMCQNIAKEGRTNFQFAGYTPRTEGRKISNSVQRLPYGMRN